MNSTPGLDNDNSDGMQKRLFKRRVKRGDALTIREKILTVFASIISTLLLFINHRNEIYGYIHFLVIIIALATLNKYYLKSKKKTLYCLLWFIAATVIFYGPILWVILYISGESFTS